MSLEKLGVGIIGLGIISIPHEWGYRQSNERCEIVAMCDINTSMAEARAKPFKANVYSDFSELLADPRVDVVDIILPHSLHYPVAKAALESKKNVIMEKPLTIDPAQGLELIQLAQKQAVKFTVAENTRFVQAYLETEKLLTAGVLGEPRFIRTFISGSEVDRLKNTRLWKGRKDGTGGGAILDAGAHSFYLVKWLLGEIDEIQATQYQYVPESEVEDGGAIHGITKSGVHFSLEFSFIVEAPWNERLEFHGSQGSVIVDQLNDPPAIHFNGGRDTKGSPLDIKYDPKQWKTNSIAAGVKDFINVLWEDRTPTVDPMDAYYAILAIEKSYQSVSQGGVAIKFP